jgi:copper homeostasis protein
MNKLEVIGFSLEACLQAQAAGVHRIELCDNPKEGGTTPSWGFLKTAREQVKTDLYVMIRPRGGDFLYTELEYEMMRSDVKAAKVMGYNGIVFGILNANGTLDKLRCKDLVAHAAPIKSTLHRAFDRVADPFQALEDAIECGFERILTSGLQTTALEGASLLEQLVEKAKGRIIVMPGSGVNSKNILELKAKTGALEFHSSARALKASNMDYKNEAMQEDLQTHVLDEAEVKAMLALLNP